MANTKRVLIVGENPDLIDFSDPAIPEGVTPDIIRKGLEQSLVDLRGTGRVAELVYLETADTAPRQLEEAFSGASFDVIVVGAGLRIVPKQTIMFEVVMNTIHRSAPHSSIAFNTSPDDSAAAAERQLDQGR